MENQGEAWLASLDDPLRETLMAAGEELSERIQQVVAPLRGEPAFDPGQMARRAEQIALPREARFAHPLLERAVRVGLAHIEATFQGDHPKYGVGAYAGPEHDGFPPTIIAAVDALTLWGQVQRAERLLAYWLTHFVRAEGTLAYYGPSVSEYGQLLTTTRRLWERGGSQIWLQTHRNTLVRLAEYLQQQMRREGRIGLIPGVPEADERQQTATYFHNSAWAVRGLEDFAFLSEQRGQIHRARGARQDASSLRQLLLDALEQVWPQNPQDWWLRPMVEEDREGYWARPQGRVTANRLGSYTNYRYWPELLSSGVLPRRWMERIVNARLTGGGQFCGTTRFMNHLDDWPLMEYLDGLWHLGRMADYRLSLWGHIACHQAEDHLTAYEQVSFPPGRPMADYCLPCQLVAVRAAGRLLLE